MTKRFGGFTALDGVSFTIGAGETVALLGRNGAGKSTLIGCLMGFLVPDTAPHHSGPVEIFGADVLELPRELRARTGFVPQTMSGFGGFRAGQLIDYIGAFYSADPGSGGSRSGGSRSGLAPVDPALLEWAGLDMGKTVRSLSGGQKQRLAILLAMRHRPSLLVLDEPVASLDPHARRDFMNLLGDYARKTGASVLISSHILSDLERLCSRLLFLREGRVVLDVPTALFRAATRWIDHDDPAALEALPFHVLGRRETGLLVRDWDEAVPLPEGATVSVPDFEDAFLEITAPARA